MFESFQNFVPKITNILSINAEVQAAYVCHSFRKLSKEIFKRDDINDHIKPAYFKAGILLLKAETSGFAQEIVFKKEKIMFTLNELIKEPYIKIKEIKIQIEK